jgi:hypothetical protein
MRHGRIQEGGCGQPKMTKNNLLASPLKPALASIPDACQYMGRISRSKFYEEVLPNLESFYIGARHLVVVASMDRLIAARASIFNIPPPDAGQSDHATGMMDPVSRMTPEAPETVPGAANVPDWPTNAATARDEAAGRAFVRDNNGKEPFPKDSESREVALGESHSCGTQGWSVDARDTHRNRVTTPTPSE